MKTCEKHGIEYWQKMCPTCNKEAQQKSFDNNKDKLKVCTTHNLEYIGRRCPECRRDNGKRFYHNHKEELLAENKKYREEHVEEISIQRKQYRLEKKDEIKRVNKEYHSKPENKAKRNAKAAARRKTDPAYRLKQDMNKYIHRVIKSFGGSKNSESFLAHLPYTLVELIRHIEKQFLYPENLDNNGKVWMNWNNQGIYNSKTWDENDSLTWAWNLDHRDPQSDFPYDSMDHPNFKKVWALENLRPLRADKNLIDGANRARHQDKTPSRKKKP